MLTLLRALRATGTGSFSINVGSPPTVAIALILARGFNLPYLHSFTTKDQCSSTVYNSNCSGVMDVINFSLDIVEPRLSEGFSSLIPGIGMNSENTVGKLARYQALSGRGKFLFI